MSNSSDPLERGRQRHPDSEVQVVPRMVMGPYKPENGTVQARESSETVVGHCLSGKAEFRTNRNASGRRGKDNLNRTEGAGLHYPQGTARMT